MQEGGWSQSHIARKRFPRQATSRGAPREVQRSSTCKGTGPTRSRSPSPTRTSTSATVARLAPGMPDSASRTLARQCRAAFRCKEMLEHTICTVCTRLARVKGWGGGEVEYTRGRRNRQVGTTLEAGRISTATRNCALNWVLAPRKAQCEQKLQDNNQDRERLPRVRVKTHPTHPLDSW
jgi:hypothetical protein